jgi:hypothetical protein
MTGMSLRLSEYLASPFSIALQIPGLSLSQQDTSNPGKNEAINNCSCCHPRRSARTGSGSAMSTKREC